ncbi:hypothetical protein ESB00_12930 [Oleiharenicola lentus]|jgi:hypothetical protein|uniref:Uncharacterized protein n=1 Tax=Oleiharenicola lentus TaxID=2508720 RepID=A0A4Q1CCH6_9BACT|nr:hypothetical protein [Oleiharenicola lentus]RXK56730.1 hypothetical protein ESB00_12930 [Oleiharenicola lentus]
MAKFNSTEWEEIRKKFRNSIMADTSLVSLAQNLDTKEWPHKGEDEKPSKYIDFSYDELLMLPEIAGSSDRADHLIGILKETLAFDDPFGDMVAQVEVTSAKENPILKTLGRLGIPENFPLALANFSEGTRVVCASEGIKTIGEFANLGQQMSTKVVLGGDFRNALNALTHGDEEGIGKFLPYRKGSTGLHLPEAVGLIAGSIPRIDQVALAKSFGARLSNSDAAISKTLSKEELAKMEAMMRLTLNIALEWFKDGKAALIKHLKDGGTYERYFIVLNDPVREAIAVRLVSVALKDVAPAGVAASAPVEDKKGGFFSKLFGKR